MTSDRRRIATLERDVERLEDALYLLTAQQERYRYHSPHRHWMRPLRTIWDRARKRSAQDREQGS